jgi:hypothetical protein
MSKVKSARRVPEISAVEKASEQHVEHTSDDAKWRADAMEAENSEHAMTVVQAGMTSVFCLEGSR